MNISEFAKPVTAKSLNESLAKRFGQRVKLENFSLGQLQDARNKLRTKISQFEISESFDTVLENETYQKSKLMLDILNAEIAERGDIEEDAIQESTLREGAEDQAGMVMAAKDMVDRVTSWMEDTAEMQTESMLELADAIRDEMGSDQMQGFVQSVKPALEAMYTAMESTRASLTGGVGQLTGEGEPMDAMGGDDMDMDMDMEPTTDMDADAGMDDIDMAAADDEGDDFGADAAAAGGEEEAGRAKRESIQRSRKLGKILAKESKKK